MPLDAYCLGAILLSEQAATHVKRWRQNIVHVNNLSAKVYGVTNSDTAEFYTSV